jgi:hypothetical protein
VAILCCAGLLAAGCTSEDPGLVGTGLVDARIDTVLVPVTLEEIDAYSALKVLDAKTPLYRQQVLYVGQQEGTRSVMLVNFDFGDIFTDEYPAELFTEENIKNVFFSLTKLNFYGAFIEEIDDEGDTIQVPTGQPVDLYYVVNELTAPFDSTAFAVHPGTLPSFDPLQLNSDYLEPNSFDEPRLKMYKSDFLDWVAAGQKIGLVVQFTAASEQGLVGFASREMKKFNEIPPVAKGTVPEPNFIVEFQDNTVLNFLFRPYADTATFHEVPLPPADVSEGIHFRTGLRSYPAVHFDQAQVPANAFINRAVLRLTSDPVTSYGPLATLIAAELDTTEFQGPDRVLDVDRLASAYNISSRSGLDPKVETVIEFDVTQAVQRVINDVYEGTSGLVLMAPEGFAGNIIGSSVPADFYYRQFNFYGTGAAVGLRPVLRVTYSHIDELDGGGE